MIGRGVSDPVLAKAESPAMLAVRAIFDRLQRAHFSFLDRLAKAPLDPAESYRSDAKKPRYVALR